MKRAIYRELQFSSSAIGKVPRRNMKATAIGDVGLTENLLLLTGFVVNIDFGMDKLL